MITKTLAELSILVNGELSGDGSKNITGFSTIDNANNDNIIFLSDKKNIEMLANTKAGAVILPLDFPEVDLLNIRVKDPYLASAIIHNVFYQEEYVAKGISEKTSIGENCKIPTEVTISSMCVIGNCVNIGNRVTIHPGVVIGDDVIIGDDCVIYPNVTIYAKTLIGNRVFIHSGTVIGADGFGYATDKQGRHVKRPHVGIVQIDDDVELGANTCVDRGTFGKTWIKTGAKIDNLVQIAHNVVIGEGAIVVAQVGIAGSSELGRNVVLGGQTAVAGHIHLGDRAMVAAKSGVHNNLDSGSIVSGIPAIPHRKWLRASTSLSKLPDLIKEVRKIKKQITTLLDNYKGD